MLQVGVSLMYGAPGSFTVECKHSVGWYTMVHLDRSFQHQLAQLYTNKLVQIVQMLCCVCTAETLHRGLVQDATKVVVLQYVWHWRFKPRTKLTRNQISMLRGAPFGCRNSFPTPGPLLRVAPFAHQVLGQRPPKHEGAASPWATKDSQCMTQFVLEVALPSILMCHSLAFMAGIIYYL